jgi:hypothetical protein
MKEDQPAPGTARPPAAKNPPIPAKPAIEELQAQVLALRALVEVLIERDLTIKTVIFKEGNAILRSVIKTSELTFAPGVLERAKRILLWTNSRKT